MFCCNLYNNWFNTPINYTTNFMPFGCGFFGFNNFLMPFMNFEMPNYQFLTPSYYATPSSYYPIFGGGATYNFRTGNSTRQTNYNPVRTTPSNTSPTQTTVTKPSKVETPSAVSTQTPKFKNGNEFRQQIVKNFEKYLGYNENDGSFRKFSNSKEWCADFVTYVVKETYEQSGKPVPKNFGNHRCEILKQWAINNNCFINIAGLTNKAEAIKTRVKVGDILILRENNASHTGVVTKINTDGSFETIEGNVKENNNDVVTRNRYNADNKDISGFIRLPY